MSCCPKDCRCERCIEAGRRIIDALEASVHKEQVKVKQRRVIGELWQYRCERCGEKMNAPQGVYRRFCSKLCRLLRHGHSMRAMRRAVRLCR